MTGNNSYRDYPGWVIAGQDYRRQPDQNQVAYDSRWIQVVHLEGGQDTVIDLEFQRARSVEWDSFNVISHAPLQFQYINVRADQAFTATQIETYCWVGRGGGASTRLEATSVELGEVPVDVVLPAVEGSLAYPEWAPDLECGAAATGWELTGRGELPFMFRP